MRQINPTKYDCKSFWKQWTDIICSNTNQQLNHIFKKTVKKKKVLSYKTGEMILYSVTDCDKNNDSDYRNWIE